MIIVPFVLVLYLSIGVIAIITFLLFPCNYCDAGSNFFCQDAGSNFDNLIVTIIHISFIVIVVLHLCSPHPFVVRSHGILN